MAERRGTYFKETPVVISIPHDTLYILPCFKFNLSHFKKMGEKQFKYKTSTGSCYSHQEYDNNECRGKV